MATNEHAQFDSSAIDQAMETARRYQESVRTEGLMADSAGSAMSADKGELKISAQCISVSVQNGRVCLNLPLGLGSVCLPVPSWVPNGATVQACLDLCTVLGVPCGVEVTVSFNNQRILQKGFGCC